MESGFVDCGWLCKHSRCNSQTPGHKMPQIPGCSLHNCDAPKARGCRGCCCCRCCSSANGWLWLGVKDAVVDINVALSEWQMKVINQTTHSASRAISRGILPMCVCVQCICVWCVHIALARNVMSLCILYGYDYGQKTMPGQTYGCQAGADQGRAFCVHLREKCESAKSDN